MKSLPFDGDLSMFVQPPRPLNLNHLAFLRYLGEQGRLEHDVAGKPSGPLVTPQKPTPAPEYSGRAA